MTITVPTAVIRQRRDQWPATLFEDLNVRLFARSPAASTWYFYRPRQQQRARQLWWQWCAQGGVGGVGDLRGAGGGAWCGVGTLPPSEGGARGGP